MSERGPPMPDASFVCAADALASWRDDVLSGKLPLLFPVGTGELARIEIGPGRVLLFGGAPGARKTAFPMQAVIDTLRLTPTLRAVVCNVEMGSAVLLDRQLARLSGIDLTLIRHRRLGADHADRIDQAMNTLEPLAERLVFVRPPSASPTWQRRPTPSTRSCSCWTTSSASRRQASMATSAAPSTRRWITSGSLPTPGLPSSSSPRSVGRRTARAARPTRARGSTWHRSGNRASSNSVATTP